MSTVLRISVRTGRESATEPVATSALQQKLEKDAAEKVSAPGREHWGSPRSVPRPGAPDSQGAFADLLLELLGQQVLPEAVKAGTAYLVWTAVSYLRSQPDPTRRIVISETGADGDGPGRSVTLEATGLTEEQLESARRDLFELVLGSERRRPDESEDRADDED